MGTVLAAVVAALAMAASTAPTGASPVPVTAQALASQPALVIPIALHAGMPIIEMTLNGKGPLRIGLDTGAMGGLYLFHGGAERAGLQASGEVIASDPSGANPQTLNTYGDAAIGMGGRVFLGEVTGAQLPAPGVLDQLDGITGLEVFGPGLVTIDFARRQVTVEAGGLPPPDRRTVFAYEGPLPRLPVEVEGRLIDAYLDTGNVRAGIVLPAAFAGQLTGRLAATPAGVAHTISSDVAMYRLDLKKRPQVGQTVLSATQAQFPSVAPIGIVGAAALEGLIVRIDTSNQRIQVLPGSTVPATPAL